MSTSMAVATSSSLNPNAPLFIPAAYRQVEDFSPRWWDLVQTTAWFRDHWFRQLHEAEAEHQHAVDAALPDDLLDTEALFYAPDHHRQYQELETRGAAQYPSPPSWQQQQQVQQPRYADKPAQQHVGLRAPGRRVIHQPR